MIEEALLVKQVLELRELRLGASFFDRLRLGGKAAQSRTSWRTWSALPASVIEHRLQPLALAFLHLLKLLRIREVGGARRPRSCVRLRPSSSRRARFSRERRIA